MKRTVYTIDINYTYDNARRGAKYSFDNGKTWKNSGEAVEIILKACLGLNAEKDANTPFDKGSDIESLHTSVKSPAFTLTTCKLGTTKNEIVENYFKRTASDCVAYGYITEDTLVTYWLTMEEFREYLEEFGYLDKHSGYVRGKKLSNYMLYWLDKRVA